MGMNFQQMRSALFRLLRLEEGGEETDLVNLAISASLTSIENYIGYQMAYGNYTETHEVKGTAVYLDYAPVNSIFYISADGKRLSEPDYRLIKQKGIILVYDKSAIVDVSYNAGYEEYPFDLAYAIVNYAAIMFRAKDFVGVSSEKLGDYSVTYRFELPPFLQPIIAKYRRV